MISPQGQNQKYLHGFADRVDRGIGVHRPAPAGSTLWWMVRTVAVVATTVLGCVGFTGVLQSAAMQCHGVGYQGCATLVIDDLTGKSRPA
jgi:hypothetical protein